MSLDSAVFQLLKVISTHCRSSLWGRDLRQAMTSIESDVGTICKDQVVVLPIASNP